MNTRFHPRDTLIPRVPCVYLLVSTKDLHYFYIGETKNVANRLLTHNTGRGPVTTANPLLMPWAIAAYITGFINRPQRQHFESTWKILSRRNRLQSSTLTGILSIGYEMITQHNATSLNNENKLRLVECGSIINIH